jgi:outer membrane lipoprotein-sorting protein
MQRRHDILNLSQAMICRRQIWAVFLFVSILPLTGCLFRSRKVERVLSSAPLKSATQQELVDAIDSQAAKIQTMQATVDIDTSVGGANRGKVTDYKEIRGYVLARKPSMLRMIGLLPIVRNRAFDMVSDGKQFKLWIPPKNRFVMGRNDVVSASPKTPLENVRPQNIYDALLIRAIDPEQEIAVLENGVERVLDAKRRPYDQPDYEIVVVRKGNAGWYLSRKIIFSRTDLKPHRQQIYNENGVLATDVRYGEYRDYDGVSFPKQTEIERPQEEYDITLNIVKLELNKPLNDDQFELQQPAGAEVVHLGQQNPQSISQTPHPGAGVPK